MAIVKTFWIVYIDRYAPLISSYEIITRYRVPQ